MEKKNNNNKYVTMSKHKNQYNDYTIRRSKINVWYDETWRATMQKMIYDPIRNWYYFSVSAMEINQQLASYFILLYVG